MLFFTGLLVVIGTGVFFPVTAAQASTRAQYARILPNTYLYNRDNGTFRPVTSLPIDYFVLVTDRTDPQFFAVAYHDLLGFVRRENVVLVDFEPVTKSAVGILSPFAGVLRVYLHSTPDHTLTPIILIPSDATLHFYGTIEGTLAHPLLGTNWFFVRYFDGTRAFFGYVYGGLVEVTTPIPPNIIEAVRDPNDGTEHTHRYPFELDSIRQWIIIVCLGIAGIFTMLALYRPLIGATNRPPRHRS